ncbi:polysaccharide deacetylase family protein [Psychroflexus aestuariivivens]|uniref:polysaccharide deacetylase family protein n=1 Tax=Psychroflexus aestuariivivens TaxID=1795040 RepID=UPI002939276A|nr:polysaccharide deacetylase family protein [Psychroflexus aestuariivivens]
MNNAFLKRIFPKRIWRIETDAPNLYLTFDDGPIPEITPWVLDLLKKHNAKATFFCIGENIQSYPELFQRILNEGHAIGNHTYNHLNGWKNQKSTYLKNIEKCDRLIEAHLTKTNLFRPPYGKCTFSQAKALFAQKKKIVMWDIISKDYDSKISKENCFKIIKNNIRKGNIIIFHDSLKAEANMKYALQKTLETYKDFNFRKLEM